MNTYSTIKTSIGNMMNSDQQDIIKTRKNFNDLGIEAGDENNPYIDKPLDNAIRTLQKEIGLKEDGIMNPKGETEQALNLTLAIKDKIPPLPDKKPSKLKTPPLPEHKEDVFAKMRGKDKAKKAGELASELFMGRIGRVPINNKIIRTVIEKTVGKADNLMEVGTEKLLENYFVEVELEKERKRREKIINSSK